MNTLLLASTTIGISFLLVGCPSPETRPDPVLVEKSTCVPPRPDASVAEQELAAKADVAQVGEIVNADVSYTRKVERFREEIPGVNSVAEVEYRICTAFHSGIITSDQYDAHVGEFVKFLVEGGYKKKPG